MPVGFLPFTTAVVAGALRSGHGLRTAAIFYGITFDATALAFNAVWQYARRHRLLKNTLDPAGATAIGRRFQLALVEEADKTFEDATAAVTPAARSLIARLRSIDDPPDEVCIEFGVQLSAQTGAFIASVAAEANFKVSIKWRPGATGS